MFTIEDIYKLSDVIDEDILLTDELCLNNHPNAIKIIQKRIKKSGIRDINFNYLSVIECCPITQNESYYASENLLKS